MARKSKIDKPEEDDQSFFFQDDPIEDLQEAAKPNKQKGRVALITKTRIIIVYGNPELGTDVSFDPILHSHLREGDEIDIP